MKKTINTLRDALYYQLQGLVYTETKVRGEFNHCKHQVSSTVLKTRIQEYVDDADNKLLKLERIFNYLMQEPEPRKNEVITKLISETHCLLDCTATSHLKDILVIGCIQNINAYKIACYRTAYMFAVELELDTAEDLLQQILEWELETEKDLSTLSIKEFNRANITLKSN